VINYLDIALFPTIIIYKAKTNKLSQGKEGH